MGVVKGVAKHKGKKAVNEKLDDAGVVGDVIDKRTSTGPLDKAEDTLDKTKKNIDKKTKKKR
jgi:hypothetical protein